ncbi:unnamed protein product, partial [Prorocentrum cordatum]
MAEWCKVPGTSAPSRGSVTAVRERQKGVFRLARSTLSDRSRAVFSYVSIEKSDDQNFEEFAAVAGVADYQGECDDDEIARSGTMRTSTMHSDEWLERFSAKLNEKYGLRIESHPRKVKYRFGRGEHRGAKFRDVLPVGIGGENGEIKSNWIPVRVTCEDTAVAQDAEGAGRGHRLSPGGGGFQEIGFSGAKLRRTSDGCWGAKITYFANVGFDQPEQLEKETVAAWSSGVVLYEAVEDVDWMASAGSLPIHEMQGATAAVLDAPVPQPDDALNQERAFEQLDPPLGAWEIMTENPWANDAWEGPALEDAPMDPEMDFVRGDMRQWNFRDTESGRPYLKPSGFAVNKGDKGALAERHCKQLAFSAEVQELSDDEACRRPMCGGPASVDAARECTDESAVEAAGHLRRSVCASLARPTTSRLTKLLVTPREFKDLIEIDVFEEYTANGTRVSFLNLADVAGRHAPPYRAFMDQARNDMACVREQLIARRVHSEFSSVEQHLHSGRCERAGGVWKEPWRRACYDMQLIAESDVDIGPSGDAGRPRGRSICLNYQGQKIFAAPEQLCWATPEDVLAATSPGVPQRTWRMRSASSTGQGSPTRTHVGGRLGTRGSEGQADAEDKQSEKSDAPIAAAPVPEPEPMTTEIDDWNEREEELEAKSALLSDGRNCEARDWPWIRYLTERSGQIEIAHAAKAEGMSVSKILEKQLGQRKGKPGRRVLEERGVPKHLEEALDEAKLKEWSSLRHHITVELLSAKLVLELPRHAQVIPTRFAFMDKNEATRTDASNLPVKLKATLVALGNLEKGSNYRRDASTGSLLAQHVALAWAASGSLLRATAPIDGAGDAARGWWKRSRKSLLASKWKVSTLASALFYLLHGGELVGMCATRVDDVSMAGTAFVSTDSARAKVQDVALQRGEDGDATALKTEPFCSQRGRVVGLMAPPDENGNAKTCVMEWKSQIEKRVCPSTLAAETHALAKGTVMVDWLRAVLLESRDPEIHVAEWASRATEIHAQWMCDARNAVDHPNKDGGAPQDKRAGIELAALKQLLARGGGELRWVDTSVTLAGDALDDEVLQRVLYSSEYNTNASTEMMEFKGRKAAMRRDLKMRRPSPRAGSVGGPAELKTVTADEVGDLKAVSGLRGLLSEGLGDRPEEHTVEASFPSLRHLSLGNGEGGKAAAAAQASGGVLRFVELRYPSLQASARPARP